MDRRKSGSRRWVEVAIQVAPVVHEALSAFLFEIGCSGIVLEDFDDRSLKAYARLGPGIEDLSAQINGFLKKLEGIFPEVKPSAFEINEIENQDWGVKWRRFFQPDQITSRLLVVPAWDSVPKRFPGYVIRMDPGPAFGTGGHPTTRMCLAAIEEISEQSPPDMLDIGTGSGILAMYAVLLGIKRVVAVDSDPEAVRWAERNLELNGLTGLIQLSGTPVGKLEEKYSLVAANLLFSEILDLLHEFAVLVDRGGGLVLSGLLREQVEEVRRALEGLSFELQRTLYREEWSCLVFRKSS